MLDQFVAIVAGENIINGEGLANFRDPYLLFDEGFEASAGIW
jgi:hypothetical protein